MISGTKEFKAVLNKWDHPHWYGLEYGNESTIELEKKNFPFIEPNMEVNIKLTVEYKESGKENSKGNRHNKNGQGYDSEEHN